MTQRLYLVGYDVSDPKRQAVIRYNVKRHTSSGQKSAYECALSSMTKQQLTDFALSKVTSDDSFFIIKTIRHYWSQAAVSNQLPPNAKVILWQKRALLLPTILVTIKDYSGCTDWSVTSFCNYNTPSTMA